MLEPNLISLFAERFESASVPYMVTGSVAGIIYGEPRLTHDIDLVAALKEPLVLTLAQAFSAEEFYFPPPEVVRFELARSLRGHFNIIHQATGFKADVYLMGDDPLHRWAMSRRRQLHFSGRTLWVAPIEYVIVRKLEFLREGGSEKHKRDILSMIKISEEQIDKGDLEEIITARGLRGEWEGIRRAQAVE